MAYQAVKNGFLLLTSLLFLHLSGEKTQSQLTACIPFVAEQRLGSMSSSSAPADLSLGTLFCVLQALALTMTFPASSSLCLDRETLAERSCVSPVRAPIQCQGHSRLCTGSLTASAGKRATLSPSSQIKFFPLWRTEQER